MISFSTPKITFGIMAHSYVKLFCALAFMGVCLGIPETKSACKVDFKDYFKEVINIMSCKNLTTSTDMSHLHRLLNNAILEPSLINLRFQESDIRILPEDFFEPYPIQSLHLISCGLTEIPFRHVNGVCTESLATLYISKNIIPTIGPQGFDGCTAIRILDLSSNKIATISTEAFWGLDNLRELNLQFNEIRTLDGYTGLGNLRLLYLTGNGLEVVAPDALRGMNKLTMLDLSYNKIVTLDEGTLQPMTNMHNWDPQHMVYLEGNPLDCNCSLKWLPHWLLQNSFRNNDLQCATPEQGPLMILDFCPDLVTSFSAGISINNAVALDLLGLHILWLYLFSKNLTYYFF